jgi:hypothetical protein
MVCVSLALASCVLPPIRRVTDADASSDATADTHTGDALPDTTQGETSPDVLEAGPDSEAAVDADAALDTADVTDVIDVIDVTDVTDVFDAQDAAPDVVDVVDVVDAPAAPDVIDVIDATDATDATDASDASTDTEVDATPVVEIAAGRGYTCARRASGRVLCWGLVPYAPGTPRGPTELAGSVGSTALSAGARHLCLLRAGGVECVGDNASGQLGDGTVASRSALTRVGVTGIAQIVAAGGEHTCAIYDRRAERGDDNNAWCWGSNSSGQVGNGGASPLELLPVNLGTYPLSRVYAGRSHTLAAYIPSALAAWGANARGQLGLGDRGAADMPRVTLRASPTDLCGADEHSCGLQAGGSSPARAVCWGRNEVGELGSGVTTADEPSAVDVNTSALAPATVRAARCGGRTSCFLLSDQTVACTGSVTPATARLPNEWAGSCSSRASPSGRSTCARSSPTGRSSAGETTPAARSASVSRTTA